MMEYYIIKFHIDLCHLEPYIVAKWFFHWFPKNITLKMLGQGSSEYEFTKNYLFLQWPWEIANDLNELNLYHKNITYKRLRTEYKRREFGIMEI